MASSNSSVNENEDQKRWYHIVWVDENIDNHPNKIKLRRLREIDPKAKPFSSAEECIEYVKVHNKKNTISVIILIVSGALNQKVIPAIHDYRCIFTIFIFCNNYDKYKDVHYKKLRTVCTQTDELIDGIEMYIAKYNDTTDFSLLLSQNVKIPDSLIADNDSSAEYSIRDLKQDQIHFIWYRQMYEFMINLDDDDDEQAKKDMIRQCREFCEGKEKMQLRIDELSNESIKDNRERAISWYTDTAFIYRCVNTVLRKENIAQVYTYRYIIKLICKQLKRLHRPFLDKYKTEKNKNTLRVFRGQYLKLDDIEFLKKNLKNFISLNGFVSTTRDRDIAIDFIRKRPIDGFEPVLLKIDIDMTSEHSVAFADISHLSKFEEEKEVLLSIGSVFTVKSVDLLDIDDELTVYVIHLSLNQNNQVQVTQYIQDTYTNTIDSTDRSVLFGRLLFDMGAFEAALTYFQNRLDRLTKKNDELRATYFNNIGICYNELGNKKKALEYYNEALEIYEKIDNKQGVGTCKHNIASIYYAQGFHTQACEWALKAYELRYQNKIEAAATRDLLGCIYLSSNNAEAALDNFKQALNFRLKYLNTINPNHPDIGLSYYNIGKLLARRGAATEAQEHYVKAAEIYRHNYPASHPLMKDITKSLTKPS